MGLWGSAWRGPGRAGGRAWLGTRGVGRRGRRLSGSRFSGACSRVLSHGLGPPGLWGGLKTFFPWKVAAGSLLSRELSVPLPPPVGALAMGYGCPRTDSLCRTFHGPGVGWERQVGVRRAGSGPGSAPSWRLPSEPLVCFLFASRFGARWVNEYQGSGWEGTDLTLWLALQGATGWGRERQEVDCPKTEGWGHEDSG